MALILIFISYNLNCGFAVWQFSVASALQSTVLTLFLFSVSVYVGFRLRLLYSVCLVLPPGSHQQDEQGWHCLPEPSRITNAQGMVLYSKTSTRLQLLTSYAMPSFNKLHLNLILSVHNYYTNKLINDPPTHTHHTHHPHIHTTHPHHTHTHTHTDSTKWAWRSPSILPSPRVSRFLPHWWELEEKYSWHCSLQCWLGLCNPWPWTGCHGERPHPPWEGDGDSYTVPVSWGH